MKTQLRSLKQRAVQQQARQEAEERKLTSREVAERRLGEAEKALVQASAYFERVTNGPNVEIRETSQSMSKKTAGGTTAGPSQQVQSPTRRKETKKTNDNMPEEEAVGKRRQELEQKFREAEFQDGIEKSLNAHMAINLEKSQIAK